MFVSWRRWCLSKSCRLCQSNINSVNLFDWIKNPFPFDLISREKKTWNPFVFTACVHFTCMYITWINEIICCAHKSQARQFRNFSVGNCYRSSLLLTNHNNSFSIYWNESKCKSYIYTDIELKATKHNSNSKHLPKALWHIVPHRFDALLTIEMNKSNAFVEHVERTLCSSMSA